MTTKKFSQMATKKLNALLATASEEDKVEIMNVLNRREQAQAPEVAETSKPKVVGIEPEDDLTPEEKALTMVFSANKAEQLFLTPTIAVEKTLGRTIVRFALAHYVFNVEIAL